ncbi:hypothetical protein ACVIJW_011341 [Bradyrhizobium barranii subsp. barranii]
MNRMPRQRNDADVPHRRITALFDYAEQLNCSSSALSKPSRLNAIGRYIDEGGTFPTNIASQLALVFAARRLARKYRRDDRVVVTEGVYNSVDPCLSKFSFLVSASIFRIPECGIRGQQSCICLLAADEKLKAGACRGARRVEVLTHGAEEVAEMGIAARLPFRQARADEVESRFGGEHGGERGLAAARRTVDRHGGRDRAPRDLAAFPRLDICDAAKISPA